MARKPKYKTLQHLLQYYITKYYLLREKNPNLKQEPKRHIHEIEKLITAYQKDLGKTSWESEERKDQFRKEIDFLTQVYSKIKSEEERKGKLQAFKDSMNLRPVTSI